MRRRISSLKKIPDDFSNLLLLSLSLTVRLLAHKRTCEYFDCTCKPCITTRLRREHMADMQYIKRNGVVELERIKNALKTQEVDVQTKKKDVYAKIYQERMANKNKKRSKFVQDLVLFCLVLHEFKRVSNESQTRPKCQSIP